jgi:hypothetical protein
MTSKAELVEVGKFFDDFSVVFHDRPPFWGSVVYTKAGFERRFLGGWMAPYWHLTR